MSNHYAPPTHTHTLKRDVAVCTAVCAMHRKFDSIGFILIVMVQITITKYSHEPRTKIILNTEAEKKTDLNLHRLTPNIRDDERLAKLAGFAENRRHEAKKEKGKKNRNGHS